MAVLYINEQGASIGVVNDRVQVRRKRKVVQEMPALHVERIVLMTPAYITQPAIRFFMDRGIDIAYLSQNGKFYGQFTRGDNGFIQLRLAQFQKYHDPDFRLGLAKGFIRGKTRNMFELWRRQRRHGDLTRQLAQLRRIEEKIDGATTLDSLRGFEGSATAIHFRLFRGAIQDEWRFQRRAQHPPPDPVNAMLSLGYTLLYSRMASTLQLHGLDPFLGFFHEPKRGHAALASDMIEEWRCPVVDAVVLRLINTKQITPNDFEKGKNKCTMKKTALQGFAQAFESRLRSYGSPTKESNDPIGGFVGQVRQLARLLLDRQKQYSPISL